MRARFWITIIAVAIFACTAVVPPRARAISDDFTTPLIISGAVVGAVALIFLIAIMVGSARETEFPGIDTSKLPPQQQPNPLPWSKCPQNGPGLTVVCW